MRLDSSEEDEGVLNLTPLIDVVFLLLVFFLASTTFAKDETEMQLNLPEASTGTKSKAPRTLVVHVASSGVVTMDGREVSLVAMRQKLKAAAARDAEQRVLIRGDEQARHGVITQIIDACREAKLRIAFGAKPTRNGNTRGGE